MNQTTATEDELRHERDAAIRQAVGDLELLGVPAEALIGVYTWMADNVAEGRREEAMSYLVAGLAGTMPLRECASKALELLEDDAVPEVTP